MPKTKRREDKVYVLPENLDDFFCNSFVRYSPSNPRAFVIQIPFPPSVNSMYRSYRGRTVLSAYGRSYKEQTQQLFLNKSTASRVFEGELVLSGRFFQPDRRRRDLDNLLKASLDVVSDICGFDDSQIKGYKDVYMAYSKDHPRALLAFYPADQAIVSC